MAQVTVTDQLTGDCLFDRLVPLAPDYRCSLPDAAGIFTITIAVGDRTYEGQFVL